jgi:hypothetical protein
LREPTSIPEFLSEVTDPARRGGGSRATAFWPVVCPCGGECFRLVRAGTITQRTCTKCGEVRYISRFGDGLSWEEAVEDRGAEPFTCGYECDGSKGAQVCLGLAGYPNNPELDAVLWFYVGIRCCGCGIISCFNDGKVGRGPMAAAVFRSVAGERVEGDE